MYLHHNFSVSNKHKCVLTSISYYDNGKSYWCPRPPKGNKPGYLSSTYLMLLKQIM